MGFFVVLGFSFVCLFVFQNLARRVMAKAQEPRGAEFLCNAFPIYSR